MSFVAPPVWLQEDAEIRALLHAIVDRFDRQRADARQRHVSVAAERHLTTLARVDAQADQCWALVRQLEQLGVLSVRSARSLRFLWKASPYFESGWVASGSSLPAHFGARRCRPTPNPLPVRVRRCWPEKLTSPLAVPPK